MKMIDSFSGGLSGAVLRDILPKTPLGPAVPRRWQWHHHALLKMREGLLSHRLQLTAQAAICPEPLDSADAADEGFEHDLALGQLSGEQDILYEIQAALAAFAMELMDAAKSPASLSRPRDSAPFPGLVFPNPWKRCSRRTGHFVHRTSVNCVPSITPSRALPMLKSPTTRRSYEMPQMHFTDGQGPL
jgi:hypothetical protein